MSGTTTVSGATTQGILMSSSSLTAAFGATTLTNPGGTGISITGATSAVTFGATTVGKTGAGTGVSVTSSAAGGTVTFGSLGITTANGSGLVASENLATLTVTGNAGSINATGGPALNITKASAPASTVALNFTGLASTNSATTGITIDRVSGNLTAGSTTVTNPTGAGIFVQNTSVSSPMNFGPTSDSGSGGTGVALNTNAGTVTFGDLDVAPDAGQIGILAQGVNATITTTAGSTVSTSGNTALDLSTSTLAMVFADVSASISSGSAKGVNLQSCGGSLAIGGGSIALTGTASGTAFDDTSGSGVMTYLGTVSNGGTGGRALVLSSTTGTVTITTVSAQGGSTGVLLSGVGATVNFANTKLGDGVVLSSASGGIAINGGSGTYNLGTVTAVTSAGPALSSSGDDGTINITTGSLSTTTGAARVLDVQGPAGLTTLGIVLTSINRNPGGATTTDGIILAGTNGSITAAGGTIKTTDATHRVIEFNPAAAQPTSGTYNFSAVTFTGAASKGIALTANNTGTYSFGAADFGSPAGGIGVSVASTSAAVTFRSVSQNGGNTGISLTNTTGSFTITGDGGGTSNGSGGTIQNLTGVDGTANGHGVYAATASRVSLGYLNIHDCQGFAIRANGIAGFKLNRSIVNGSNGTSGLIVDPLAAGAQVGEDSVRLTNLTANSAITNTTISGGFMDGLHVENVAGTLNLLRIDAVTVTGRNSAAANDALNVLANNGTVMNVAITNSTISTGINKVVNVGAKSGSTLNLLFDTNIITNAATLANIVPGGGGVSFNGLGNLNFAITNNSFDFSNSGNSINSIGLNVFKGDTSTGSFSGRVTGNTVGITGVAKSGSGPAASAFNIDSQGASGSSTVLVQSNTIYHYDEAGLRMNDVSGSSTLNAVVVGNTTAQPELTAFNGLWLVAGADATTDAGQTTNFQAGGGTGLTNDFSAGNPAAGNDVFLQNSAGALNLSQGNTAVTTPLSTVFGNNNAGSPVFSSSGSIVVATADTVRLIASPTNVLEDGSTNIVYTFLRWGNTQSALTVNFSVGGTAAFGTDYTQSGAASFGLSSGTVTFAAGSPVATIVIDPTVDGSAESDETVILTLTAGAGYTAVTPTGATTTILDDDTAPFFAPDGVAASQPAPLPLLPSVPAAVVGRRNAETEEASRGKLEGRRHG